VRPRCHGALLCGPSTSPLESATKPHLETHEELGAEAEDPSFEASLVRALAAAAAVRDGNALPSFIALGPPRAHSCFDERVLLERMSRLGATLLRLTVHSDGG